MAKKTKSELPVEMIPLLNKMAKRLQKAAVLQSELIKIYRPTILPRDGIRPSERRMYRKKRPRLVRLYNDIIKLSEVPESLVYHELVRAPKSRKAAKLTRFSAGERSRKGVELAIKYCKEKDITAHRGNVRNWLIKNNYQILSDCHLSELIKDCKASKTTSCS